MLENIQSIKSELGDCSDLVVQLCKVHSPDDIQYACIYIDELVDKSSINLLSKELMDISEYGTTDNYFDVLINSLSGIRKSAESSDYNELFEYLLSGYSIFLIDGYVNFFAIHTYASEGRAVEEPTSQTVIRGSKEGFTEQISINMALVRKRIKNKSLRLEEMTLGSVTKTKVSLMYIDKIVKEEILNEIKDRLKKIRIDSILDSGYIEEIIKDDRYSIFPTFLNSEKPDSVAAALLEGRVAIFVDGTAFVLTAPALFVEFFQASEDFYHNYIISSMIRILRFVAFTLTLLVPSVFISLVTFHQEMLPTPFLISIAAQREGVPFPSLIEALLMEATFEILREAGIRMPRAIGPAISIVGALVLGQAAVEAGIISEVIVIIVSITAISSFAIPNYSMSNAVRVIRFILMILAGTFGLYGVFMGAIVMTLHLCKLKTVGIPYLTPLAPRIKGGNNDTLLRFPLWKMNFRPSVISGNNAPRVSEESPVSPSEKEKQEIR